MGGKSKFQIHQSHCFCLVAPHLVISKIFHPLTSSPLLIDELLALDALLHVDAAFRADHRVAAGFKGHQQGHSAAHLALLGDGLLLQVGLLLFVGAVEDKKGGGIISP